MDGTIAIRAEGLSKAYIIGHETERERYVALRDVLARAAHGFARSAADMVRGRTAVAGDTREEFYALRDINFDVKQGEVVGIIGRNGAGKSTLLKVLSRITEPSQGRVTIRGRVASLLEVGTGFHPELTGRENIFLNGAILGMTHAEIKRKFDEIVSFAEVERFLDTPVKRYSSGMYVRLAFAVAAHLEPEILVVDEVLAVGDGEFQKKCLGKMSEVASGGRTVLFVSHNIGAVATLCSRAMLLDRGRLLSIGRTDDLLTQYAQMTSDLSGSVTFPPAKGAHITHAGIDKRLALEGIISVEMGFSSPRPVAQPVGGILISSLLGEPVWGSNGIIHPAARKGEARSSGVIRCTSEKLPVLSGEFNISLWLSDWGEVLDQKPNCLSFTIGMGDGAVMRPPRQLTGHLDWPALWTVSE